jgi:gas vesicle protein
MARNSGDGIVWFVAGAALGALGAILYAPQAGEHTRTRIGTAARTHADKVSETGRGIYQKGLKLADDASSMLERGRKLIDDPEEMAAEVGEEG